MAGSPDYPIRTRRLSLRPLGHDDTEALLAYRSIPDVCRWVPFTPMATADIDRLLAGAWSQHSLEEPGRSLTLGVERGDTGQLIGDVILFWHDREQRSGEVGWVFHPEAAGQGFATEAAHVLLHLAFDDLGLHRVVARVDARNEASARVALRLGMRQEAHLVRNEWFKGEWSDELDFADLADQFYARHDDLDCPLI